ncbi:MAG: FAD-dependent oxidoreductase [Oscillospiraceae bacterium]|nr:FAD-dependent oxidoreductase [Oscillospiraceae bacterium]
MRAFNHINARSIEEASAELKKPGVSAMAGGGDLLGALKDDIYESYPETVVNLKTIPGLDKIELRDGALYVGALAMLADVEQSELVRQYAPSLAEAAGAASTPTLREMTTVGGNICQTPRCWYYRKLNCRFDCRRKGGDRCFAQTGDNRYHSIFGGARVGQTPCAQACPAGTDIPGYMEAVRSGDMDRAAEMIMRVNPLPMITSRICPHPCQNVCNQGQRGEGVNIHCVERSVADHILENVSRFYPAPASETGKKAAVVGAGPAGLTAAYYLRREGHAVTVFDIHDKPGGVMRYGVPHYRLPRTVVDAVIDALKGMGVVFRCGVAVGRDTSVEQLEKEYDGIFLATGAWKQPLLGIGGEELALFGLDFLSEVNTYLQKAIGRNVLVCGGGNVAMDVALTAKRLGAEKVTLICLEQRHEMPASAEEIKRAEEEGVVIHNGWGLGSVVTDASGKVTGLDSKRCVSVRDENGRFAPVYDENDRTVYSSDFIILATGQSVDLSFLGEGFLEQLRSARGLIEIDKETYRTSRMGIYAAGDAASGPNIAVRAIAGARAAARSMSADFGYPIPEAKKDKGFSHFDREGAERTAAVPQPERSVGERTLTDEDAASYSAEQTLEEAKRCLNCSCYAVNQAELAPPLLALGAVIVTNEREIPAEEFFGTGICSTTVLRRGELVTGIRIPTGSVLRSRYRRFAIRKSIDFPVINLAIAADKEMNYRIWLGGVAPVPVRAEKAEELLKGKRITPELAAQAGIAAAEGADAFELNAYKVTLLKTLIKRELSAL